MKKSKKAPFKRYSHQVIGFVKDFCDSHRLFSNENIVLALSGGVDSVSLLHILAHRNSAFNLNKIRAIHINHGTRAECIKEENLVRKLCEDFNIDLEVHKLNLNLDMANFENMARKEREKIFKNSLRKDELLFLAHHLDDSFEWSLMQKFKSSKLSTSLGIPLVNGNIRRPFLCLSKDQIYAYAKENDLNWLEDQSNKNMDFERNYIREVVIKEIKKKYPNYLKHYVNQSNQLAHQLDVHKVKKLKIEMYKRDWGYILKTSSFTGHEDLLINCIEDVSKIERGNLSSQLNKLINLYKSKKRGRVGFSGGAQAYCFYPYLLIVEENVRPSLLTSQIPGAVPFFSTCKSSKSLKVPVEPFQPETQALIDQECGYNFAWRSKGANILFYL